MGGFQAVGMDRLENPAQLMLLKEGAIIMAHFHGKKDVADNVLPK